MKFLFPQYLIIKGLIYLNNHEKSSSSTNKYWTEGVAQRSCFFILLSYIILGACFFSIYFIPLYALIHLILFYHPIIVSFEELNKWMNHEYKLSNTLTFTDDDK